MTPPTLPGEVWRGDIDGPVCVTVRDGNACSWWWDDREHDWWRSDERASAARDTFRAWALSLRAERDAAQAEVACLRSEAEERGKLGKGWRDHGG